MKRVDGCHLNKVMILSIPNYGTERLQESPEVRGRKQTLYKFKVCNVLI